MDFLDYLKEKEEMEATLEVLSSHELMAQIGEAGGAINKGRCDAFIPWEKVKPTTNGTNKTNRTNFI